MHLIPKVIFCGRKKTDKYLFAEMLYSVKYFGYKQAYYSSSENEVTLNTDERDKY